jgi:hypothetical protein
LMTADVRSPWHLESVSCWLLFLRIIIYSVCLFLQQCSMELHISHWTEWTWNLCLDGICECIGLYHGEWLIGQHVLCSVIKWHEVWIVCSSGNLPEVCDLHEVVISNQLNSISMFLLIIFIIKYILFSFHLIFLSV